MGSIAVNGVMESRGREPGRWKVYHALARHGAMPLYLGLDSLPREAGKKGLYRMRCHYCFAASVVFAASLLPNTARGEEEIPPAPGVYLDRTIAQTMHYTGAPWLVRESREREEECSVLLKNLGIRLGDTVCDMGCGNGFYSLKMAQIVGESGKVLAVDIQPEMLRLLDARADSSEIENIDTILGTFVDPKLPRSSVDVCLLVDVYHEFSHPVQMLAAIRAAMKPTGRVALVEFRLEDPEVPIKLLHKMSKEQMLKEFAANQFKLVGQYDKLPWQHVMFFARDDSPLETVEPTPWPAAAESKEETKQ